MLSEVVAGEIVKELICDPRLCIEVLDFETAEMVHAQRRLDLFFYVVNYPGLLM